MKPLRITSCQAMNTFSFTAVIAEKLQSLLGLPVINVTHLSWADRYKAIDAGEIDLAWMCGWPFVYWETWTSTPLKPMVAPVMQGARYDEEPVYFSDVIVRKDSCFERFDELQGKRFAYNYVESQSGHHIVCDRLRRNGQGRSFFGETVQTEAHLGSVAAVQEGRVDAAAIDSTLYDWLRRHRPEITDQMRVVEQLGPSPMPPVVARSQVSDLLCQEISAVLCTLANWHDKQDALEEGCLSHFVSVETETYRPIAMMYEQIKGFNLA